MNTQFQFKGIPRSQGLSSQIQKSIQKIERLTQGKGFLKVKLSIFKKKYNAQISLKIKDYQLEGKSCASYLHKAVTNSVGKVYSQLKRKIQMEKLYASLEINASLLDQSLNLNNKKDHFHQLSKLMAASSVLAEEEQENPAQAKVFSLPKPSQKTFVQEPEEFLFHDKAQDTEESSSAEEQIKRKRPGIGTKKAA